VERIEVVRFKTTREAFHRSAGYAAWVRVGLLRHARRVFVSLFTDGKTLFFRFGDKVVDCLANHVEATRASTAPGVKRFRFAVDGRVEIDETYLWVDWSSWPDNGDILSHVERITKDRAGMFFTILFRKAAWEGRPVDTAEVAEELRHRADELARSSSPSGGL
jgi:hypothetical protein